MLAAGTGQGACGGSGWNGCKPWRRPERQYLTQESTLAGLRFWLANWSGSRSAVAVVAAAVPERSADRSEEHRDRADDLLHRRRRGHLRAEVAGEDQHV